MSGDDLVACNDDGCAGVPPESFHSEVTVTVAQGQCYKVRVGGWQQEDTGWGTIAMGCTPFADADIDRDGDVDLDDLGQLQMCLAGPGSLPPDCAAADIDDDGDVDVADFAALQVAFTGAGP